jgi:flavin reductase (DIM6/NTAB) family NADH-FMN oxidoreductase RutF
MKEEGKIEKFYQYSFPMQTVLVTCNDSKGKTNIITIAWHTPISIKPPLYGLSIAPGRYSHKLISETKELVVNFVPYNLVEKAHFCGRHSGKNTDKISETKLTFSPSKKIKTPIIKECYAHLECTNVESFSIGDHTFFVGEVVAIQSTKDSFENHLLKTEKITPLYYIGGNSYTTTDTNIKKKF